MEEKKDNVEKVVTADWLEKYIEETQKYDIRDWYLALSLRKNVHDYIVAVYQNPNGYLSPQGNKNFGTPLIAKQLDSPPRPVWKTFLDDIEKELNTSMHFLGEYPTPDKIGPCLSFHDFPFIAYTVANEHEEESVITRVFMSDGCYRKYTCSPSGIVEFQTLLNDETYFEWRKKNPNPPKAIKQLPSLVQEIEAGDILSFTENQRRGITLPEASNLENLTRIITTPSRSVKTVTADYIFWHINTQIPATEKKLGRRVRILEGQTLWSDNHQAKIILAEINLMKSDKEINEDFKLWLAQTRQKLDIPSPSNKQIVRNHVQKMTDTLTRILALAYIDFKILEFYYRIKKSESFFFKFATEVSSPPKIGPFTIANEDKITKRIKYVVKHAMSTDFMHQLSEQVADLSAQK